VVVVRWSAELERKAVCFRRVCPLDRRPCGSYGLVLRCMLVSLLCYWKPAAGTGLRRRAVGGLVPVVAVRNVLLQRALVSCTPVSCSRRGCRLYAVGVVA